MLRLLDNIYRRFDMAWTVFKNPDFAHNEYLAGIDIGKMIARAQANYTLASFSPDDFSNQHFKLGYYYAAEQLKKVTNGQDNPVD
jgi:hypothetical protein